MKHTLQTLFEEHAATSLDKQAGLADSMGSRSHSIDLNAGTITFRIPRKGLIWLASLSGQRLGTARHVFPIQVLGSESYVSNTWLWAWANEQSRFPHHVLAAATRLRELGAEHGIAQLAEPQLNLKVDFYASRSGRVTTGHFLSLIACGVYQADAYFCKPYEGGAAFLLIKDAPPIRESTAKYVTSGFMELIQEFPCDHRRAFEATMRCKGFQCLWEALELQCTSATGAVLAMFDGEGRLLGASTKLGPPSDRRAVFDEIRGGLRQAIS